MAKKGKAIEKTEQKITRALPAVSSSNRPSSLLDTRVIYCGDNLEQLAKLPDACIDLIYIDPGCEEIERSFNSNRPAKQMGEVSHIRRVPWHIAKIPRHISYIPWHIADIPRHGADIPSDIFHIPSHIADILGNDVRA